MHTLASDAHLRFVWTLDCQTANGFLWAEHTVGTRNARRSYNKEKDAGGVIVGLEHCQCQMGISLTTVIVRYPLYITRLSSQIPIDIIYASCLFPFTDDSSSPICPKRRKRTSTSKYFFGLIRCLKTIGKVSLNIASEASYAYILSAQKIIKTTKMVHFGHFGEFLKIEACSQTVLPDRSLLIGPKLVENAKIKKFNCDILSNFQTMFRCCSEWEDRLAMRCQLSLVSMVPFGRFLR